MAGSRIYGFNISPRSPISLLEVHGYNDQTVPANASNGMGGGPPGASVSDDHFYYTEIPHVTRVFADAAGCAGPNRPYPTPFDRLNGFQCNTPHGACGERSVIQCTGGWGHTWPLHVARPLAYARLVLDFFSAHPLPADEAAEADAAVSSLLACQGGNGTLTQALHETPPEWSDGWALQREEMA
jgi:poly(3-hydroxybutyrate) depolymerase